MKDFIEIRVGIESKMQEEQIERAKNSGGPIIGQVLLNFKGSQIYKQEDF